MAQKPEWVLNLGTYSKKTKINRSQPGLDLARTVTDTLENKGVLGTVNCCDYFPTVPRIAVATDTAPTEAEMVTIPLGGLFIAYETATPTTWYLRVKVTASTSFSVGNS
jgi:hypothetical protein